jgi:hypothetical protein
VKKEKLFKWLFFIFLTCVAIYFVVAIYLWQRPALPVLEMLNQPCPILNKDHKVCRGRDFISYELYYNKTKPYPATVATVLYYVDEPDRTAVLPSVFADNRTGNGIRAISSNTAVPITTPIGKVYMKRTAKWELPDGKVAYGSWITEEFWIVDCEQIVIEGPPGKAGATGAIGKTGPEGPPGKKGGFNLFGK